MVAAGPPRRTLPVALDVRIRLPEEQGFRHPRVCLPGILVVQGPAYSAAADGGDAAVAHFAAGFIVADPINQFPLVVVVDDSQFASQTLANFLWTTFTRSNPAADIHGIESFVVNKHWGCRGALVIDARTKPHHAPPLVEDAEVTRRVSALGAAGGPLHGII
jgi:4-hydroxy-3-polyprenylbenzoate decarboxylase